MSRNVTRIDLFAAVNAALFLVLCVFRYHARFLEYVGADHIREFFLYAAVIFTGIVVLWRSFRSCHFDLSLLILLQIGILMHFCGAFLLIDGGRLYDAHILGVRYDKYVHLVNAFSATFLVGRVFQIQNIAPTWINTIVLVFVVMGMGALIEVVEYVVVLTVPNNLVGGYDNNMQDLMANTCGSLSFLAGRALLLKARQLPVLRQMHTPPHQAV